MGTVVGASDLDNSFAGSVVQVCVVSRDLRRTMAGMVRLGIGPWQVHTFSPKTVDDMTYRGAPATSIFKIALAFSGTMMWELIQPMEGPSIYGEFLEKHGEGVHHVAMDCAGADWDTRLQLFADHGYEVIQSGRWLGKVPYAYFATEDDVTTTIETFIIPDDFPLPEPDEWYPAAPPAD
ncbi:MAG TPA: VOC family protein [Pseudonocardia sp.]|nr:VOC family protein [Pseudonocardia sp.]